MYSENGLRANIKNTIDTKKIQALMNEAHVDILVGFRGGQQHHMNVRRKNRKDSYKDINGVEVENIKSPDIDKLAMMQHFGAANIPARPFLTDAIRQNSAKLKKMMQKQVTKLEGRDPEGRRRRKSQLEQSRHHGRRFDPGVCTRRLLQTEKTKLKENNRI